MYKASKEYINLAKKINVDPCQMALAFCLKRPFMTSVIFGATSEKQLKNNIQSVNIELLDTHLNEIKKIHKLYPVPF